MRLDRAALIAVCGVVFSCAEHPKDISAPSIPPAVDAVVPTVPSNAIFSENFESGSLSAFQDGVTPSKQKVIMDSTLAHSGKGVLQITYPANGKGGWLTRFFMPGYDS